MPPTIPHSKTEPWQAPFYGLRIQLLGVWLMAAVWRRPRCILSPFSPSYPQNGVALWAVYQ